MANLTPLEKQTTNSYFLTTIRQVIVQLHLGLMAIVF